MSTATELAASVSESTVCNLTSESKKRPETAKAKFSLSFKEYAASNVNSFGFSIIGMSRGFCKISISPKLKYFKLALQEDLSFGLL